MMAKNQKQPGCSLTKKQIKKMWYYSAVTTNDVMKFAGKLMELEKNDPE